MLQFALTQANLIKPMIFSLWNDPNCVLKVCEMSTKYKSRLISLRMNSLWANSSETGHPGFRQNISFSNDVTDFSELFGIGGGGGMVL